jgi:DNA-binding MarR family transcriptional regulator
MTDDAQFTNAILATANTLLREAGRLFRSHGVTAVQFNVLNLLADAPEGLRPSELTAALVVDASSTTYVLDRMETLGWLRRSQEAADRRAWRIGLTPAGRDLYARVRPIYRMALRKAIGAVKAEQLEAMTAALQAMQAAAPVAVDAVLAAAKPEPKRRRKAP